MKEVHRKTKAKVSKRVTNPAGRKGEPMSLYPLRPEEVTRAILKSIPATSEKRDKQIKKHA